MPCAGWTSWALFHSPSQLPLFTPGQMSGCLHPTGWYSLNAPHVCKLCGGEGRGGAWHKRAESDVRAAWTRFSRTPGRSSKRWAVVCGHSPEPLLKTGSLYLFCFSPCGSLYVFKFSRVFSECNSNSSPPMLEN